MPRRSPPDPVERLARPFLPKLARIAAEQGRSVGDYFLLIGKYDTSESAVIPRAMTEEFLGMAKTAARRRKYAGLLASPHALDEVLVMVCAGDHVEGHWMRVPRVVAPAQPNLADLGISEKTANMLLARIQEWMELAYDGVCQMGDQPGEYMAFVRLPDPRNPQAWGEVHPKVFPRSKAREAEELQHLAGTKKLEQLFEHLEAPCDDVILFMDAPHRTDIMALWRDKELIEKTARRPVEVKRV